jgi:hypothetical protein
MKNASPYPRGRLYLNTVLILIRLCESQPKSATIRCFFFLHYFTTFFGLTDHHQVYKVCLKSVLRCPFMYTSASRSEEYSSATGC